MAKVENRVLDTSVLILDGVKALQCELVSTRNENKANTDALDVKLTQILAALMLSSVNPSNQFAELKTIISPKSEKRAEGSSLLGDKSNPKAQPETALEVHQSRNLRLG